MADVDYDALEETLTWGEKFFATSYIQLLFQPVNLLLVVFFLLAMFFGKIMFATPYFVLNSFYKKKAKKARATQRDEARKLKVQRKLQRESLRRRNSAGSKSTDAAAATGTDAVELEMTSFAVAGDDETKAEEVQARTAEKAAPAAILVENTSADAHVDDTGPDGTGLGFGWLDWELVENDNPAVAVSFTSFLVALCIALTGARTPANIEDDFFEQIFDTISWSFVGIIYLGIANVLCQRIYLSHVHTTLAHSANLASSIVESGSFLASGIIIRSSLAGENTDFGFFTSLTVSFCYFVAGQLLLLFSVALIQWLTKYDDQKEIAKDNCAAAIKIFGTIVSIGIVIAHPLFVTESVYAFGLYYVCATVILVVLRYWLSYIIIPGKRTVDVEISEDANWGVASIEAATIIAASFALGSVMPNIECYAFTHNPLNAS